jgi:tRNA(Met) C34 N-acetyltransferase TmcA
MIRFVFLFLLLVLCAWVVMQVVHAAKGGRVDWTRISFMAGFIVLAFWLRHATGLG